jgi:predicted ArsR family transcriptional regulator
MKETMMLKDLEQVKIFAHPLRARLVEAFADKPRTAKQAAEIIGQKPTKLYHHVEALERVGLIKLVKTQKKRGTLEKYYRTVARRFSVDSSVFKMKGKNKELLGRCRAMFATMLENTMHEISESIADKLISPEKKERQATLARRHIRTTHNNVVKLERKIQKLLEEFADAEEKEGDVEYALTLVFYPVVRKKKRGRQC